MAGYQNRHIRAKQAAGVLPPPFIDRMSTAVQHGVSSARGALTRYRASSVHKAGMGGLKDLVGRGKYPAKWMRWLGPASLGYSALSGLSEGGFGGMVRNTATEAAMWYGLPAGLKAVGLGLGKVAAAGKVLGAGALGAGIAGGLFLGATGNLANAGSMFFRKEVKQSMRRHARLEMGAPAYDPFGNIATMRQRSIQAIQSSKINGRSALGNEALLFHM